MKRTHAVSAALRRAAKRPSNNVPEEDFVPRMVDIRTAGKKGQSDVCSGYGDHDWPNYDDFGDFPDAPLPR